MKHHGCITEFAHQRAAELVALFRSEAAKCRHCDPLKIFAKIVNMPSSRFWISEERASCVLAQLADNKLPTKMRPHKLEMFIELYQRYIRIKAADRSLSLRQIVSTIIYEPAPRFYMSAQTAMHIYYKYRRQQRVLRKKQLANAK